jgi:histidyl-tRNA synthetase
MAKKKGISGFPEWLPQEKRLEDEIIAKVKVIYESHGFTPIETPAVELLETLTSKGVVDKEIYALRRYAAEEGEVSDLGLHFDLTVPFARYVAEHLNDLVFPFKRYQLQKVWRGERPQKGRFREFYQFDVDIVARDVLPLACDAEVVTVLAKVLRAVGVGTPLLKVNNRKLLIGFYQGLGIEEGVIPKVVALIDKLDKLGEGEVTRLLSELPLTASQREEILAFAAPKLTHGEVEGYLKGVSFNAALAEEGAEELVTVLNLIPEGLREYVQVHLQIARGLDYYTGTIVESEIQEFPEFGSVGSGGRYNDLVSNYLSQRVPGVGVSFGLTRMMDLILRNSLLPLPAQSPAKALVAVMSEDVRIETESFAETLRERGVSCDVSARSPKLGKQIDYADKKGIPFVVFLGEEKAVKNIQTGEQTTFSSVDELMAVLEQG